MNTTSKEQIGLAIKALQISSDRAKFLYNPLLYAKKENIQLDPRWVKVIEEEVYNINKSIFNIQGKYQKKKKIN